MATLTVDEAVEAVAAYRRMRGQSPDTIRLDAWVLRAIGVTPQEATLGDLEAVVMRGRTRSSRAAYSSRIRSCYRVLRELGLITTIVDQGLPSLRCPPTKPRPLADAQVARLLDRMVKPHLDVVRVALLTGARAMEVWAMTGADLGEGPAGPEIMLHGKGGKDQPVPAHPTVVDIVTRAGTLGRIWPMYSSPAVLSSKVGQEMRRVLNAPVSFHACRHTFATRLYEATSDIYLVSRLMRHSSVETTQVYAQIADTRPAAVVALLAG